MNYGSFAAALAADPDRPLSFSFPHGSIKGDYHVTEVMASTIDSVDCGGRPERRLEAVLQLVEPRGGEGAHMNAGKAASILRRSERFVALSSAAEVVLELRPEGSPAAQRYTVAAVEPREGALVVEAAGTTTQCKPAAGREGGCGPSPAKGRCCS